MPKNEPQEYILNLTELEALIVCSAVLDLISEEVTRLGFVESTESFETFPVLQLREITKSVLGDCLTKEITQRLFLKVSGLYQMIRDVIADQARRKSNEI